MVSIANMDGYEQSGLYAQARSALLLFTIPLLSGFIFKETLKHVFIFHLKVTSSL